MIHNSHEKVVTRFAPSPTGVLHIGGARTALFNYLFARQHSGKFLLRIEDTDKARSRKEYEKNILESLAWLSLDYDAFCRQSERTSYYEKYIKQLLSAGFAYVSREENRGRQGSVIRFRNPNKEVHFDDMVRGIVTFNTTEFGDFVIAKDMQTPLYHLTVVVDDFEMGVTHVIRGEDHISNTPRQLLIQEAIGAGRPRYAHIPLILAPDRSKLSKRYGALSVMEYRDKGYLSDALINYLALLGWHPLGDEEIFSLHQFVDLFDINMVQKGGATFNIEKLNWFNKEYIKILSEKEFKQHVKYFLPDRIRNLPHYSDKKYIKILPLLKERITTFGDIKDLAGRGELDYFFESPQCSRKDLMWRDEKSPTQTKKHLDNIIKMLQKISPGDFTPDGIKDSIWDYATREGRGSVLWPLRFALSGKDKSPDPFTLASVLGKKETIERLKEALITFTNNV